MMQSRDRLDNATALPEAGVDRADRGCGVGYHAVVLGTKYIFGVVQTAADEL